MLIKNYILFLYRIYIINIHLGKISGSGVIINQPTIDKIIQFKKNAYSIMCTRMLVFAVVQENYYMIFT